MWNKEQFEDFIRNNQDKIKQFRGLIELMQRIEINVLGYQVSAYMVGKIVRIDLKLPEE